MSDAERLGRLRQATHATQSTGKARRLFADRNHENIIGAAGELAFATRYRLPMRPINRTGAGDGGYDFATPIGTVQVKAARFPKWLWIDPEDLAELPPWIVQVEVDEQTLTGRLIGWTTNTVMRRRPTMPTRLGEAHFLPRALLCPMNHLACGGLIDYAPDAFCCDLHPPYYSRPSMHRPPVGA